MFDSARYARLRLVSFAVLLAFALIAALHAPESALAKSASYASFDVDLTVGNDAQGQGGTPFAPNTYACRPPGAYHGPFKSNGGCLLFELHFYDPV